MSDIKTQLVIFDFDWSMVDQDTDRYVLEVLSPRLRRKLEDEQPYKEWTDLLAETMHELHKEGATRQQIEHSLITLPYHPAMIRGVKALKAASTPKTTFLCLSASNHVYIRTIMELPMELNGTATGSISDVTSLLTALNTTARLAAARIYAKASSELTAFLERRGETFDRLIYVGDGSNDFCPAVRLSEKDVVLCRRARALERRIKAAPEGRVKATVKYWEGAWEVEEYFLSLISEKSLL
ncbi:hypothetical protein FRC07_013033 [Ceratobasidium sp. 392]|nr:hypothetical protein FRC07_013033 [Ceratobasidium sp. 392]